MSCPTYELDATSPTLNETSFQPQTLETRWILEAITSGFEVLTEDASYFVLCEAFLRRKSPQESKIRGLVRCKEVSFSRITSLQPTYRSSCKIPTIIVCSGATKTKTLPETSCKIRLTARRLKWLARPRIIFASDFERCGLPSLRFVRSFPLPLLQKVSKRVGTSAI